MQTDARASDGSATACSVCPFGTYADARNTDTCTPCISGTFLADPATDPGKHSDAALCLACSEGEFSATPGAGSCLSCPGGTTSEAAATTCDIALCRAEVEYYDSSQKQCVPAKEGMNAYEFSKLRSMSLDNGYWRTKATSAAVLECPQEGACIGDTPPANGLLAMENSTLGYSCRDGHTGPLCSVCLKDYYLDVAGQQCTKCGSQTLSGIIGYALVGAFIMIVVAAASYNWYRNHAHKEDAIVREAAAADAVFQAHGTIGRAQKLARFWPDLSRKLKLLIAKLQVTTFINIAYGVTLPDIFGGLSATIHAHQLVAFLLHASMESGSPASETPNLPSASAGLARPTAQTSRRFWASRASTCSSYSRYRASTTWTCWTR